MNCRPVANLFIAIVVACGSFNASAQSADEPSAKKDTPTEKMKQLKKELQDAGYKPPRPQRTVTPRQGSETKPPVDKQQELKKTVDAYRKINDVKERGRLYYTLMQQPGTTIENLVKAGADIEGLKQAGVESSDILKVLQADRKSLDTTINDLKTKVQKAQGAARVKLYVQLRDAYAAQAANLEQQIKVDGSLAKGLEAELNIARGMQNIIERARASLEKRLSDTEASKVQGNEQSVAGKTGTGAPVQEATPGDVRASRSGTDTKFDTKRPGDTKTNTKGGDDSTGIGIAAGVLGVLLALWCIRSVAYRRGKP